MKTALSFVKLYINIDIFFQHSLCMELSSTHPQFYSCWNLSWVFWLFWDLLLFLFRGAFEVCRPFEGRDTLKKSKIQKRALTVRPGSEVNQFLSLEFQCLTWLLCFLIPQRFITKIDSYVAKGARSTHSTSACSRCRTHAMCLQFFPWKWIPLI